MLENSATELIRILEFGGEKVDVDRAIKSADACRLENLRAQEEAKGFIERRTGNIDRFFDKGGSRWRDELSIPHLAQIEHDHGEALVELGYKLATTPTLEVV
jgi:hypothetical protein